MLCIQRSLRAPVVWRCLNLNGLSLIRNNYEARHGASRARRVIRSTLELPGAIGSTLTSNENHKPVLAPDEETTELDIFVSSLQHGAGSEAESVQLLWAGKKKRSGYVRELPSWHHRGDKESHRPRKDKSSETEQVDQSASLSRQFLKGVSSRAGRAGKRLGGGVSG
jgi:hypothetical protein